MYKMARPLILVTNDDSIVAPGIRALIEVMKELGDVVVVAPDSPQSAWQRCRRQGASRSPDVPERRMRM